MHPPHRITAPWPRPGPQMRGQLREPRRQPGRILGRQLPHHRAPACLSVGVLHCHAGLARTAQPAQHRHPRPSRPTGRQLGIQPGQQFLPARQVHRPRRQPHCHPVTTRLHGSALAAPRRLPQGHQRLEQQRLHPVRRIHRLDRDPGALDAPPECPLPLPVHRIGKKHARQRQDRILIKHEYQPRQAQFPGRGEFQLRIGTIWLIPHRRAIPKPDNARVHIRLPDLLAADPGRFLLPGGEIRHVQHHPAGPDHRLLGRRHKRPARRILAQLGGVTQEHPQ